MIDLTPLDVRNKRGDFKKGMRGYDPQEVDVFLELVAERLEALVRENIQLRDRAQSLQQQVDAQTGREQAVQDALVTAQELRKDIREQSQREADHVLREAESEARRIVAEAEAEARSRLRGVERQLDHGRDSLQELERRRTRFLQEFRNLLQRELDVVEVEEERRPLEERAIDLDLGASRRTEPSKGASERGSAEADEARQEEGDGSPAPENEEGAAGGDSDTPVADDGNDIEAVEPRSAASGAPADAPADPADASAEPVPRSREEDLERDVGELSERGEETRSQRAAPPPEVGDTPSSLELELMAGAAGSGGATEGGGEDGAKGFPDVPDLETVLAEAGMDEVRPPESEEISPPPAETTPEDHLALFDDDEDEPSR